MPKIWAEEPKECGREVGSTCGHKGCPCGHKGCPCGRPWAPRTREPSAPVGPTRPPRGGDVSSSDSLVKFLSSLLLSSSPSLHTSKNFEEHLKILLQNSTIFVFLFWSYLSHTNSKSIDSKTKIVGLKEGYKSQTFLEVADFTIFLSWAIFSPWSVCMIQLLLFQFHLWSSLDSYYLIDEICWEVC